MRTPAIPAIAAILLTAVLAIPQKRISDVSPVLLGARQLDDNCSDCGPGACCDDTTCIWDADLNYSCIQLRTTTITKTVSSRRTVFKTATDGRTITGPTLTVTATTTTATTTPPRRLAARQDVLWTTITATTTTFIKPDFTSTIGAAGSPVTETPISTIWLTEAPAAATAAGGSADPPSTTTSSQSKAQLGKILGGVLGGVFLAGMLLVGGLIWWNKRQGVADPFSDKHSSTPPETAAAATGPQVRQVPSVLPPSPISRNESVSSIGGGEYVVSPITPSRGFQSFGSAIGGTGNGNGNGNAHGRQLSIPRKPVPMRGGG